MAKTNTKLPLILILALPILLIISTEVAKCSFTVFGQTIYAITFVYPLLTFISITISKKRREQKRNVVNDFIINNANIILCY